MGAIQFSGQLASSEPPPPTAPCFVLKGQPGSELPPGGLGPSLRLHSTPYAIQAVSSREAPDPQGSPCRLIPNAAPASPGRCPVTLSSSLAPFCVPSKCILPFFFSFLAMTCGMWDLSSPAKDVQWPLRWKRGVLTP